MDSVLASSGSHLGLRAVGLLTVSRKAVVLTVPSAINAGCVRYHLIASLKFCSPHTYTLVLDPL
jgi:hypothetical protein